MKSKLSRIRLTPVERHAVRMTVKCLLRMKRDRVSENCALFPRSYIDGWTHATQALCSSLSFARHIVKTDAVFRRVDRILSKFARK